MADKGQVRNDFVNPDPSTDCILQPPIHTLVGPLQTPCGHRICASCLDYKLTYSPSVLCPAGHPDCVQLSKDNVVPDNGAARDMSEMQIFCLHRKDGCSSTMKLMDLEKHTTECPYQTEECLYKCYGCTHKPTKLELKDHLTQCDYQPEQCLQCKDIIPKCQMRAHHAVCKSIALPLPNNIGTRLTAEEYLNDVLRIQRAVIQVIEQRRQLGVGGDDLKRTANTGGVLLWPVNEYKKKKEEALSGKCTSLYSQPFFTSRFGYKMCARIYLNGDGLGKGTHLSVFFVVMRSEFDVFHEWPFRQKVTLTLMNQSGTCHISETFRPDPTSSSFKKPDKEMNIASGCPLFVLQSIVEKAPYMKDDTIVLKVTVDTSDL